MSVPRPVRIDVGFQGAGAQDLSEVQGDVPASLEVGLDDLFQREFSVDGFVRGHSKVGHRGRRFGTFSSFSASDRVACATSSKS